MSFRVVVGQGSCGIAAGANKVYDALAEQLADSAVGLGIAGCIISTIISLSATNLIFDPLIIHKHALKQSARPYFRRNLTYFLVVLIAGVLSWWVCGLIPLDGIWGFIVRGCICVAIPGVLFILCFCRTEEFRFLINTARDLLRRPKAQ